MMMVMMMMDLRWRLVEGKVKGKKEKNGEELTEQRQVKGGRESHVRKEKVVFEGGESERPCQQHLILAK